LAGGAYRALLAISAAVGSIHSQLAGPRRVDATSAKARSVGAALADGAGHTLAAVFTAIKHVSTAMAVALRVNAGACPACAARAGVARTAVSRAARYNARAAINTAVVVNNDVVLAAAAEDGRAEYENRSKRNTNPHEFFSKIHIVLRIVASSRIFQSQVPLFTCTPFLS
jgi:hypothetical protein